jgi:hypothetical protein
MRKKIEMYIKSNVPHIITFVGLAVVSGATISILDLYRAYVFPIGYIAGLVHGIVEKLVRNKVNLK